MPKDVETKILEARIEAEESQILKDERRFKRNVLLLFFLLLFLMINVVIINYFVFRPKPQTKTTTLSKSLTPSISPTVIPTVVTSPTPITQTTIIEKPSVKEYFISFGSGSGNSMDWEDVGGLQTTVDLSSYGNIKEIRLEASITVPTANQSVWVRLFNETDKHPVWYSDATMNGGPSGFISSQPIIVDSGQKTYQVQMKTQLGYLANLGQARLHIILN